MAEEKQPSPETSDRRGCCCLMSGCGCFALVLFLGLFLGGPAPLLPYFFPALYTSSGEHLPQAEKYSPKASDYSFYNTFLRQVCEFAIPEDAFLEMCREKEWKPVAVESLPDLPDRDNKTPFPRINCRRKVPLNMPRYVYIKPEHEHCDPWNSSECHIDSTGKTDQSCFHSVSRGYYFEIVRSNGGGIEVLYDAENGWCYILSNHH